MKDGKELLTGKLSQQRSRAENKKMKEVTENDGVEDHSPRLLRSALPALRNL